MEIYLKVVYKFYTYFFLLYYMIILPNGTNINTEKKMRTTRKYLKPCASAGWVR